MEPPAGSRSQLATSPDGLSRQIDLTWIVDGRLSHRGDKLRETLAWAEPVSVCSNNYRIAEIDSLLAQGSQEKLAAADAYLTEGLVRYVNELRGRESPDPEALLTAASKAENIRRFLAGLVPVDPAYRRLRSALDFYTALADSGGWQRIPAAKALKPGMIHAQVGDLRRRLTFTGDLPSSDMQSPLFDAELEAAVRRFQVRHGLAIDGVVESSALVVSRSFRFRSVGPYP